MKHKSTKPHKSGAKKKKGGLKGAEKLKAAKKGVAEQIAKPSGVLVGLVAASLASNLLDKIPFLAPPAVDDGTFSIKKIVKPIILVAAGTATAIFTHKKTGAAMQFVNGLGYGIAGGGLLSGVKAVTGKSLVSGLGAVDGKAALEANYYKEQANDMAKMLEEKKFNPELINGSVEDLGKEQEELGKDWGSEINSENSGTVI